jgi:tetratricopeptide (TPR) repeat protein
MTAYSQIELNSIYELGRLYYEMGYFAPAERLFSGLAAVDEGKTPARVGLGLVKLERGLVTEAASHFRLALQSSQFSVSARFGLCCAFIAGGEFERARSLLVQLERDVNGEGGVPAEHRNLWEAMNMRCSQTD